MFQKPEACYVAIIFFTTKISLTKSSLRNLLLEIHSSLKEDLDSYDTKLIVLRRQDQSSVEKVSL